MNIDNIINIMMEKIDWATLDTIFLPNPPSLTVLNLKFLLSTEKLSFFTILLLRNLSFCYILIV